MGTLLRSGVAKYSNLPEVMKRMREHDDVILAPDTNVLLDCTFTAVLLPEIYAKDFPNWILVTVPKIVMGEVENKANITIGGKGHPRYGWPSYDGMLGQRALQEILELDKPRRDRPGFSIMTIGELLGDSESFEKKKNWWKDSEIRDQFRVFLKDIDFHKGTFFLSEDRVNAMMSLLYSGVL